MTESEPSSNRLGLHLLGGGITGAFFHFGVLAALDDHLSRKATDYDVYVGSSAGSLVATLCAVGMKPQTVVEAVLKEDTRMFDIGRRDIYRFSVMDWSAEVAKFFWTLFYLTYLKVEFSSEAPSFFWGLKDSLPSGLFSMRYYESWIKNFFERHNLPTFFSQIDKEVYIPSYDVDSSKRIIFGTQGFRHIPFYKAVTASSSIPIFFKPVEIENRHYVDGGMGEIGHLDIAANASANLIIAANPMVPINNDMEKVKIKTIFEEKGRIRDKGFTYIADQSLRGELRARFRMAMNYLGYRYPGVDVLLIEPDEDDPTMFLYNPMEFDSRAQIVEYAYELTQRKLKQNSELWKRTLDRHGITLVGV